MNVLTKTPWLASGRYVSGSDTEESVAECDIAEDAAFIVQAVNSHARLVEALTNFLVMYERLVNSGDCGHWDPANDKEVIAAKAALEAAHE